MIQEVAENVYSIDCEGCPNNSSPANRNCMLCIMKAASRLKPEVLFLRAGIFNRVLGREDTELLRDFVEKVPFKEELWSDPLGCYRKGGSPELRDTLLIRKSLRYKLNPAEIYHKVFSNRVQPRFVGSVFDDKPASGKSYKIGNSSITVGGGWYIVEPSELGLDKEEVELILKVMAEVSEDVGDNASDARTAVAEHARDALSGIDVKRRAELTDIIERYTTGYGVLEILFRDKDLQDIYVDSPDNRVHVFHADGEECRTNLRLSNVEIERLATRFRSASGRAFDQSYPMLYLDLERYNIRVCGICEPFTFKGTAFAFRKHVEKVWTLQAFVRNGMLDHEAAGLLDFLVDSQKSMLITGARSSGKTSLLASLMAETNRDYRVLVMEDTAELPVRKLKEEGYKIQHIRTRTTGEYEVTVEEALRTALRLGESVLVIGEVRGPEARSLFEAMRVGAAGNVVMGTIHGSSAYDTWDRVVNDLGVPSTSFKATDVVITCAAKRKGEAAKRARRVVEIAEVGKKWSREPVFRPLMRYERGRLVFGDLEKSELIRSIAGSKEMAVREVVRSIKARAEIKKFLAEKGLLEVRSTTAAKEAFQKSVGLGYDAAVRKVKDALSV